MTELKAGRELDALIAEKVMGLKPEDWRSRCFVEDHRFDDYEFDASADEMRETGWCYTCGQSVSVSEKAPPRYSTSIADVWEVVGKMREEGWMLTLSDMPGESMVRATASFAKAPLMDPYHPEANAVADGPALAICLAALSALSSFPDSTKEGEPK